LLSFPSFHGGGVVTFQKIWGKVSATGEAAPSGADGLSFLLRWVNTQGDKVSWSETVSATISA